MDRTTLISRNNTGMPLPEMMPSLNRRLPSAVTTARLSGLGATDSGLTPTGLVQRLPSIVNPDPVVTATADCGWFTLWVSQNPMMALGALGVIAYFTFLKGGK